ncbi:MAG: anti-sigma factor [Bacteroidota bacterium]
MDLQQYITSGKLELYVLGRLDPSAMREVERYAREYPEIRAELDEIERALEAYAAANASPLNPDLLPPLLAAAAQSPPPPTTSPPSTSVLSWFPWLLALAACGFTFYLSTVNGRTERQLDNLEQNFSRLETDCDETQDLLRQAEGRLRLLTTATTRDVLLAATENAARGTSALVFYNPDANRTLFRATNLPPPPAGKQYQLWAIDAAGPKDLGVLAADLSDETLLEVVHLPNVAAFAITLEDAGGKPAPDLSQLQVIGNV